MNHHPRFPLDPAKDPTQQSLPSFHHLHQNLHSGDVLCLSHHLSDFVTSRHEGLDFSTTLEFDSPNEDDALSGRRRRYFSSSSSFPVGDFFSGAFDDSSFEYFPKFILVAKDDMEFENWLYFFWENDDKLEVLLFVAGATTSSGSLSLASSCQPILIGFRFAGTRSINKSSKSDLLIEVLTVLRRSIFSSCGIVSIVVASVSFWNNDRRHRLGKTIRRTRDGKSAYSRINPSHGYSAEISGVH